MSFRHNEMGILVSTDPVKAHSRLAVLLFENQGNASKVGKILGVNKSTVTRWCAQLEARGHGDPRHAVAVGDTPPKPTADVPLDAILPDIGLIGS